MKYFGTLISLIALLVLVFPTQSANAGELEGYVYDATDSTAIQGALVHGECIETQDTFNDWTDINGHWESDEIDNGAWYITCTALGYQPADTTVNVPFTGRNLNFYLDPVDKD